MKMPKFTHGYIDQHGRHRFYLRRAGHKKIPLPGLPWSPEFMAAREAALKGEWSKPEIGAKRTVAGTVNAAIVSYYQTSAFNDGLANSSRKMRRAILERFREEHGDKRMALMHKKALQAILSKKSPAAAANWRKALRGLIDHAMSLDMLTVDPLAGIKLVPIKSDGHHPWEADECAQFEAHHPIGTRARLRLRRGIYRRRQQTRWWESESSAASKALLKCRCYCFKGAHDKATLATSGCAKREESLSWEGSQTFCYCYPGQNTQPGTRMVILSEPVGNISSLRCKVFDVHDRYLAISVSDFVDCSPISWPTCLYGLASRTDISTASSQTKHHNQFRLLRQIAKKSGCARC
jgi:hypothetical protein